ncbi:hypothetical protein [Rhodococcus sp. NPDC060176]|uniref:hypothetical protein n=1 Tax=unclassified Rhodococcus (in: high G+C Gram-positive bacteria) TaxID=192944 RepID=UPI0036501DD9
MTFTPNQPDHQRAFGFQPPTTRAIPSLMPDRFGPNLVGSLWACAGIVAGSLGPWTSSSALDHSGIDECGAITLVLAMCAVTALIAIMVRDVTPEMKNHCTGPLVGIAVLIVAVGNAAAIVGRSPEVTWPSIGWGLWVVIASAVILCITSSTVAHMIRFQAAMITRS